jgi:hypothetical protein
LIILADRLLSSPQLHALKPRPRSGRASEKTKCRLLRIDKRKQHALEDGACGCTSTKPTKANSILSQTACFAVVLQQKLTKESNILSKTACLAIVLQEIVDDCTAEV